MIEKMLLAILVSSFLCSVWCMPKKVLPDGVYVVKDERQKGKGNVHFKFDGLVVAAPVEGAAFEGVAETLSAQLLEAIFGRLEHYHEKLESDRTSTTSTTTSDSTTTTDKPKSPTADDQNPVTTTMITSTDTISP